MRWSATSAGSPLLNVRTTWGSKSCSCCSLSRTPAARDAWQRRLTVFTRQTRGFHPWRYNPLSPSNNAYNFFAKHHTHIQQPHIRGYFCPKSPPPSADASLSCRRRGALICNSFQILVFFGLHITTLFSTNTFYFPPFAAHVTHTA